MPKTPALTAAIVAAVIGVTSAAAATPSAPTHTQRAVSAAARHLHVFNGTITSHQRSHHRLRVHTSANQSILIHTTAATHWDNCDWDDMTDGHHVSVHAYRSHGIWVASAIQNGHHHGGDEAEHAGAQHE